MTSIEWTEQTWNPVIGCSIVSPGCTNCYAMQMAARCEAMGVSRYDGTTKRINGKAVWTGKLARAPEATLLAPLKRKKPTIYFVNSMSDLFHQDCPDEWIDQVFAVMALCPQHTFQVLTKRARRMHGYLTKASDVYTARWHQVAYEVLKIDPDIPTREDGWAQKLEKRWPLPNVWLGVSAERQQEWDERKEHLRETPAAVRFASFEPLLGPIIEWRPMSDFLHWAIVGGESGSDARPMHPMWARDLRDQCTSAGVAFFFKQWGEWGPCSGINVSMRHALCGALCNDPFIERDWMKALDFFKKAKGVREAAVLARMGKHAAGRHLDGQLHDAMPLTAPRQRTDDRSPIQNWQ